MSERPRDELGRFTSAGDDTTDDSVAVDSAPVDEAPVETSADRLRRDIRRDFELDKPEDDAKPADAQAAVDDAADEASEAVAEAAEAEAGQADEQGQDVGAATAPLAEAVQTPPPLWKQYGFASEQQFIAAYERARIQQEMVAAEQQRQAEAAQRQAAEKPEPTIPQWKAEHQQYIITDENGKAKIDRANAPADVVREIETYLDYRQNPDKYTVPYMEHRVQKMLDERLTQERQAWESQQRQQRAAEKFKPYYQLLWQDREQGIPTAYGQEILRLTEQFGNKFADDPEGFANFVTAYIEKDLRWSQHVAGTAKPAPTEASPTTADVNVTAKQRTLAGAMRTPPRNATQRVAEEVGARQDKRLSFGEKLKADALANGATIKDALFVSAN